MLEVQYLQAAPRCSGIRRWQLLRSGLHPLRCLRRQYVEGVYTKVHTFSMNGAVRIVLLIAEG